MSERKSIFDLLREIPEDLQAQALDAIRPIRGWDAQAAKLRRILAALQSGGDLAAAERIIEIGAEAHNGVRAKRIGHALREKRHGAHGH